MIAGPLLWTRASGNFWLGLNNKGQLYYVERNGTTMILVFFPMMAVGTGSEYVFDRVTEN
jgi:hypothetical protein